MAIRSKSVNRHWVVGDLFDSFHGIQNVRNKLKDKNYAEESIFEFLELTAQDNLETRAAMLKDLGLKVREIKFLDRELAAGKIFLCVDALEEDDCEKVEKILNQCGALECEKMIPPAKKRVGRKSTPGTVKVSAAVEIVSEETS